MPSSKRNRTQLNRKSQRNHEPHLDLDALRCHWAHRHADRPARPRTRSSAPARRPERGQPSAHWPSSSTSPSGPWPSMTRRATSSAGQRRAGTQRRRTVPPHRSPPRGACLNAGVDYLDISNELQVFRALYSLDEGAQRAGIAIVPGVGFGVVATNCLVRYVSDAVGGAEDSGGLPCRGPAQPGLSATAAPGRARPGRRLRSLLRLHDPRHHAYRRTPT